MRPRIAAAPLGEVIMQQVVTGYYDENGAWCLYPLMSKVITVTPVVQNNNAYDAGDVIFDAIEIPNCIPMPGGSAILDSIFCLDTNDQKAQMHLLLMNAATVLGTLDSAPDIDDTEALTAIANIELLAASYVDLGGASVLTKNGIGLPVQAASGSRSLWVAGFTTGTPTYLTGCLKLSFGFRYR